MWDYHSAANQQFNFIEVARVCDLEPELADLDGDCYFDLGDVAVMGGYWLRPCAEIPHHASLGSDCIVDMGYLNSVLANYLR